MFKIIRCGKGFGLVIIVTPHDATPETQNAKFYLFATWQVGECKPYTFNEISKDTALCYFTGHADGLGFESVPENLFFIGLEEALSFVKDRQKECEQEHLKRIGFSMDQLDQDSEG